jgi:hypothetical protein
MWCDFGWTAWQTYRMRWEHDVLREEKCLLLVAQCAFRERVGTKPIDQTNGWRLPDISSSSWQAGANEHAK